MIMTSKPKRISVSAQILSRTVKVSAVGMIGFGLALSCPLSISTANAQNVSDKDYQALQERVARLEALLERVSTQQKQNKAAEVREKAKLEATEKEVAGLRTELTKVKTLSEDKFQPVSATQTNAPVYAGSNYAESQPAGCTNFGGSYIGANLGWAFNDTNWVDRNAWVDNFSTDWTLGTVSSRDEGLTGGLLAGYNVQRGCMLFGVVADASIAGLGQSDIFDSSDGGGAGTSLQINHDINAWGTLRTRAGVVVDSLLIYATGGLAWADIDHSWTISDPNNPTQRFSKNGVRWGGVGGFGTQYAINDWISLNSEILYIKFAEESTSGVSISNGQQVRFDSQDSMWVSRIGVNMKLDYPGPGQ